MAAQIIAGTAGISAADGTNPMAGRDEQAEADRNSALLEIKTIARSPALISANVDDEIVIMSINKGHYFGLDDIASEVWRRLDQPSTLADLVESLVQDYDAPRETIERDVVELLRRMADQDLVTLS